MHTGTELPHPATKQVQENKVCDNLKHNFDKISYLNSETNNN